MQCEASELLIMRFIFVTNDNLHDDTFLENKISRNTSSMIALTPFSKLSHYGERVSKFIFRLFAFMKSALKHGENREIKRRKFDLLQIISTSQAFGSGYIYIYIIIYLFIYLYILHRFLLVVC